MGKVLFLPRYPPFSEEMIKRRRRRRIRNEDDHRRYPNYYRLDQRLIMLAMRISMRRWRRIRIRNRIASMRMTSKSHSQMITQTKRMIMWMMMLMLIMMTIMKRRKNLKQVLSEDDVKRRR